MYRTFLPALVLLGACAAGPDTIVPVSAYSGVENRSDARVLFDGEGDGDSSPSPGPAEYGFSCAGGAVVEARVEDGVLILDGADAADCSIFLPAASVERLVVRGDGEVTMAGDAPLTALTSIDLRGAGKVTLGEVDTERLDMDVSGTGDLTIEALYADELGLWLSGAGDVTLAGEARSASIELSGNGDLDASALVVEEMDISVTGSGSADVYVTGWLVSDVSGNGDVEVEGGASVEGNLSLGM